MKIIDISEPALVFRQDDSISKVIAKMLSERRGEAVITDGKELKGVVFSNSLVRRNITNPDKTKISGFIEYMSPVDAGTPVRDIISSVLMNDYKSVLVEGDDGPRFATKLGMLNAVMKEPELKGKKAKDVMNSPHYVRSDDSISVAVSMLRDTGVSRLPVVGDDMKVEGLVESIDMLRMNTGRSRMREGEEAGEKLSMGGVKVSGIMLKDFPVAEQDACITDVIKGMMEKGIPTSLVSKGGRLLGIITPKPILRLLSGKPEGVHVRISGLQEEDEYIRSVIDEEIASEIKKLGKIIPIDYMVMHVDRYHKQGKRKKYSVKSRLVTEKGMFFADDYAWDLTKAVSSVLSKLEREVMKKKGKAKSRA
ncbi:MAG: hypothetical protein DRO99_01945 [Candidatus Aenigmatarchaeota archaeon]|nr:MAG: hypothetical protein DRO99_01945 [Candidatus Aenigmarchaeota archaeon]